MIARVGALGRAELLLFWRNRTALFNALLTPLAFVAVVASTGIEAAGMSATAFAVTGLLGFILLASIYYVLVSTYVARRESLVLKRLRVGELTDTEILAGGASPVVAIALIQVVVVVVAGAIAFGLPMPVNLPVLLLGAVGGIAVFVLLAAASAVFTKNVELAQVTTLPVLMACAVGSGVMLPLETFPEPVAAGLRFLPLTPAVDLMRLGWLGTTGPEAARDFGGVFAAAAVPLGILIVWLVVSGLAVRRWFRWEPRG